MTDQQGLQEHYYDDIQDPPEIEHEYMALGPLNAPPDPLYMNAQECPGECPEEDYISVIGDDCLNSQNSDQTAIDSPKQQPKKMRCCKKPPCWAVVVIGILLALVVVVGMTGPRWLPSFPLDERKTVGNLPDVLYGGCEDLLARGLDTSGVYTIALTPILSMNVYCEQRLDRGGWTVFQSRFNGYVDFDQDWITYRNGFGYLTGEFWLGNEALHQLTKQHTYQLKVEMTDVDGEVQYADYNQFSVGDEEDKYRLSVTGYTGGTIPGDSMRYQHGSQFSTKDQNNDAEPESCASQRVGGWWYNGCNWAKVNDQYGTEDRFAWMCWWSWKPVKRLIETRLMIRKMN